MPLGVAQDVGVHRPARVPELLADQPACLGLVQVEVVPRPPRRVHALLHDLRRFRRRLHSDGLQLRLVGGLRVRGRSSTS
ncbi:MAG: hypothetical protein JKY65_11040 [Planctomycetes bacterium]|nr:hypothetical protein [Planctomycetota bacterium]